MKIAITSAILMLFLVSSACSGGSPSPSVSSPPVVTPPVISSPTPSPSSPPTAASPSTSPANSGPPAGAVTADAVNSAGVTYPGVAGSVKAYQAWPRASGPFPILIVIHENRGLTEHIKDVARRFANQGYFTLAVDLLSRVGGREAFATDDDAVAAIGKLTSDGVMQDLDSAVTYLKSLPDVKKDKIGVIGYCWGGGNSLLFATKSKDLSADVVYYGPNPTNIDDVSNITAPVLGIYGQEDTRITVNVPALEAAMKKYNKSFDYKIYPGAAHAFFNDTGARYNPEASADAWKITNEFLQRYLKQ